MQNDIIKYPLFLIIIISPFSLFNIWLEAPTVITEPLA